MSKASVMIAKIKMIEDGIIPAFTSKELSMMLESMDEAERRKVKRRFRKVWRNMAKQSSKMSLILKLGEKSPTKTTKQNRSSAVSIFYMQSTEDKTPTED